MENLSQILITKTIHHCLKQKLIDKRGKQFYKKNVPIYYKIVNLIWEMIFIVEKKQKDGYTAIHYKTFRRLSAAKIAGRSLADLAKEDLIEFGIILCDGKYYYNGENDRQKGYKFADNFLPTIDDLLRIQYKEPVGIKSRVRASAKHSLHVEHLEQIRVDFAGAVKYIKKGVQNKIPIRDGKNHQKRVLTQEIAAYWYLNAFNIEIGKFWFTDSTTVGRVYSSITGFPSMLRQFLYFKEGEPCQAIDVVNCQPLLINGLMRADNIEDKDFKRVCEAGKFYEVMMGAMQTDNRDAIKLDIYQNVLFGYNSDSKFFKEFARIFPIAAEFVVSQKEKKEIESAFGENESESYKEISGNTLFSIALQDMEASIILPALREVQEAGILAVSIHDAIFAPSDNIEFIKSILLKHFEKRGLIPDFKY